MRLKLRHRRVRGHQASATGNNGRTARSNKTSDGFSVTNVLQDGPCTGIESKRVLVKRMNDAGYDWWECASVDEARIFVSNAHKFTRAELVADLDGEV